jgi:hypothetical protein
VGKQAAESCSPVTIEMGEGSIRIRPRSSSF